LKRFRLELDAAEGGAEEEAEEREEEVEEAGDEKCWSERNRSPVSSE
jgi:hypothetical protein